MKNTLKVFTVITEEASCHLCSLYRPYYDALANGEYRPLDKGTCKLTGQQVKSRIAAFCGLNKAAFMDL